VNPVPAVEKLVKFAIKRHDQGLPALHLYFDEQGVEVPWEVVRAATPMQKQGNLEFFTPKPGRGYFGHIRLEGTNVDANTGYKYNFEIETPTCQIRSAYLQPLSGSGYIVGNIGALDAPSGNFLAAIDRSLL
jgi:hypothetical protein